MVLSGLAVLMVSLGLFFYFAKTSDKNILSPLPSSLSILQNKQVSSLDLFIPSLNIIENFIKGNRPPQISAKSAIVYDLTTEKVLYQKNPKERLPIASLTKVMTAIVALQNKKQDDTYFVKKSDLVGEDSMGLTPGESLTLEDLLYGLILHSGNDAAEVLASNYRGGRLEFISAMNQKAASYGLKDTSFTNPTGLEGDGSQYSTAYDLLVISKHALEYDSLKKVFKTFDYNIGYSPSHKAFFMENETNLLASYPGVKGIKTGYTPEAGLCLITYLDYHGHKIIGVILGSSNRRVEMKDLLDYSLKKEGISPPKHS